MMAFLLVPLALSQMVRTNQNQGATIEYSDGTKVEVGHSTQLRLDKDPDSIHSMYLYYGGLRAKVKKRNERLTGKYRFKVKTKSTTLGVRGTSFYVDQGSDAKAYVDEGSVEAKKGNKVPYLLQKGDRFRFRDGDQRRYSLNDFRYHMAHYPEFLEESSDWGLLNFAMESHFFIAPESEAQGLGFEVAWRPEYYLVQGVFHLIGKLGVAREIGPEPVGGVFSGRAALGVELPLGDSHFVSLISGVEAWEFDYLAGAFGAEYLFRLSMGSFEGLGAALWTTTPLEPLGPEALSRASLVVRFNFGSEM